MNSEIERLMQKYPIAFKNAQDAEFWNIPDGWVALLDNLFSEVNELLKESYDKFPATEDESGFSILQIKEKFGGLRIYFGFISEDSYTIEKIQSLIDQAEDKSYDICQLTGTPGTLCIKNHHYMTLCESVRKEMGYHTIPGTKD